MLIHGYWLIVKRRLYSSRPQEARPGPRTGPKGDGDHLEKVTLESRQREDVVARTIL